ncbi:DegT/DnrJ/EryC1/StrS family aminotransferase [Maricaulis sp.]|uniref:DegT/DnrJ/EryC1/StrS family aminotransferase n=1 Tax=Maricaulis sp. TaxID=1486257 RepID=UPI0026292C8F|nr:DegT/DnrJ/EryC1/StrS family aminotransferase [Maricaulis sp.]
MSQLQKERFSDFALWGGEPAFSHPQHVNRPFIANRERFEARIRDALDRGWLTNGGPLVCELEQRLADYLGTKHCVLTANATLGLELVLQALKVEGEVIMPSFTFVSTAHTLTKLGLTPVFADIRRNDHNLDLAACEALASERTGAIIPTHIWGQPGDLEGFAKLSEQLGCPLIYDAAHAFDTQRGDRWLGQFGRAEVFSLHATKYFHAVEGGAITTSDDDLAAQIQLTRNFGFEDYDRVASLGTNAKMSELHAAMGLSNLENIELIRDRAHKVHSTYSAGLNGIAGLRFLSLDVDCHSNRQYCVTEIDPDVFGLQRDQVITLLHAENVFARRYFYPGSHNLKPHCYTSPPPNLPVTEEVGASILVLPGGAAMEADQASNIASLLGEIQRSADQLRQRFAASLS